MRQYYGTQYQFMVKKKKEKNITYKKNQYVEKLDDAC